MAFLGEGFAVDTLPESSGSYEPIPAGWYQVSITGADLKSTKDGTGEYIKLRYDITGPSHQGRVVFGNLNIQNKSPKAEEIGRQQLGELMRAIGLAKVVDTDQLIGGTLQIKVSIREARDGYEASNEVRGYKALSGSVPLTAAPSAPPASAPQPPAAAASSSTAPPWARK
jgi:hypothetical protein